MNLRAFVFFGLLVTVAVIFTLFPQVDQSVSAEFYRSGGGFFLYENPVIRAIHDAVPIFAVGTGIALLMIFARAGWTRRTVAGLSWRAAAYLLAVLIIAPGLLVNSVLKDHWGRARPSQTVEFGGKKVFTPALVISDQCDRNCSFVCGHAAMAFIALGWRRQKDAADALVACALRNPLDVTEGLQIVDSLREMFAGEDRNLGLEALIAQHSSTVIRVAANRALTDGSFKRSNPTSPC